MQEHEDEKMMDMDKKAYKDVIQAIRKLASDAMLDGMGEDEAIVAELDIQKVDGDEVEEMLEDEMGMEDEEESIMPKVGSESEEEDMEDDEDGSNMAEVLKKRMLKGKLG